MNNGVKEIYFAPENRSLTISILDIFRHLKKSP